ncbi:sigma-54 dependent transcriptional regulator [Roseococcus sp. SDR]|uniref:sigma-54-dependent transcriptional regulator n=1 Tax=Roseococcus sp. SDR TaxID=2835532 RepID=UPI001BCFA778|nr:sigma-54 dependent transcriptional regulator [Roseococcus sp. SDR]MBS7792831.1 sigma-54-dependent Fis family transcriptional regulator [Roseococcus sp. SDR]MBV1848145.1 sigma-54 dependent transcriptional regulator [Roseococcus sp. SDR]
MPARVLLVEDTPTQAEMAKIMLRDFGHDMQHAETGAQALAMAQEWQPDAILVDLMLPDFSGIELMRRLKAAKVDATCIVLTAHGSVNTAVEAMREGATDFLLKPYAAARLRVTLDNALEKRALRKELDTARTELGRESFGGFIGASPAMQAVYRTLESVAASKATVFITGESGTGKEVAAETLHKASPRKNKPFVALNCGAIPRDLLESEIFGHVKGAFTGATENRLGAAKSADGGTLFLDEIGEMPMEMQVKLLRFVQSGTVTPVGGTRAEAVDVRLVCATNRDILAEVQAGRFREDLYYRLYVVPVALPPLRMRGEDVLLIARHLLRNFAREEGKHFQRFDEEAEAAIRAYPWPGNVRQLQNVLRNAVVLHDGEVVTRAMLPGLLLHGAPAMAPAATPAAAPVSATPGTMPIEPLAVSEKKLILAALEHTGQDVPRAAALLEVNPSTIYRKLTAWKKEA